MLFILLIPLEPAVGGRAGPRRRLRRGLGVFPPRKTFSPPDSGAGGIGTVVLFCQLRPLFLLAFKIHFE